MLTVCVSHFTENICTKTFSVMLQMIMLSGWYYCNYCIAFRIAGSDYQSTTITVTFEPTEGNEIAEMICGNVPIIDDTVAREPDEQFSVRLMSANPVGNFNNDASESCVTILDDDDRKLKLL